MSYAEQFDVAGLQVSPNCRGRVPGSLTFYVCSAFTGGPRAGAGRKPDQVYTTIIAAVTALAATGRTNRGDRIICLPGHVESVGAADWLSATGTMKGFSILGIGTGTMRPTLTWTVAGSTWLLDTNDVEIANMNLIFAATAATIVVTPITVSGSGCRIVDCYINWGTSTTIACGSTLGAIAVVAGTRFHFEGNTCVNLDVAGTAGNAVTFLSLNGADYAVIRNNKITGATTVTSVGVIHCVTTLSKNITVANNELENLIASSTVTMSSAIAGVTGKSFNNYSRVNSGILAETASSNWSVTSYNNYTADTVNQSGALDLAGGAST